MKTLQELGLSEDVLDEFNNLLETNPQEARNHWLISDKFLLSVTQLILSSTPARR